MAMKINDAANRLNARFVRKALVSSISTISLLAPALSTAQGGESGAALLEEIVVKGIRDSLTRAMDAKRYADGVVDSINAEDIGKFPDTNLAESLQRITGVSINRVNGEGARVTVRGFGSGFNLVTLNGRVMPTADVAVVGSGSGGGFAVGTSRSFDFSNMASEGVSSLKVYKTGNAALPSGGIGAVVDIGTTRPLDNPGLNTSIGAKAVYDTSVDRGSTATPEVSGLFSWSDDDARFGVSVFGSYQDRESAAPGAASNNWNIESFGAFSDLGNGRITSATEITNAPANLDDLVSYPNDSRLNYSESQRERINGQLVFQFSPSDALTLTADATYYKNDSQEQRQETTSWFARPFSKVTFDGNPVVNTAVFLEEDLAGVKDLSFGQIFRGTEDTLESFGFNADWQVNDGFKLIVDAHTSDAESNPNNPAGHTLTEVSIGANILALQNVDYSGEIPVRQLTFDDSIAPGLNVNGALDLIDLGSSIDRTSTSSQKQSVDELLITGEFEMDEKAKFSLGVNYRKTKMEQRLLQTTQSLGDWGITQPGDVVALAPGVAEQYCLSCLFSDFDTGNGNGGDISFRADATELDRILSPIYTGRGSPPSVGADGFNSVDEEVFAFFGQFSMESELNDRPVNLTVGVRWEDTDVGSTALFSIPERIVWTADNDFRQEVSADRQFVSQEGGYSNLLPNMDFSIEVADDVIARVSFSKTLARSDFSNLFVADSASNPLRPTALGGVASGTTGNANLSPLVSNNFDISVEHYFDDSSYVSIGFFEKRVQNFVGTGQSTKELFGLRDATSGAAGSRSGDALAELGALGQDFTDVNLFTMTALIDDLGSVAAASAEFQANLTPDGVLDQTFINETFSNFDIVADANDPLIQFEVTGPINNREGKVRGMEFAVQHFFGDSGFGVQANYTVVDGNIGVNVGADPSVDQFALLGLSDSANLTLIYEKHDFSVRAAYNWRASFLAQTNTGGGNRNPEFVENYGQLDMNVSYTLSDNLLVSLEGINLLGENTRTYARSGSNLLFAQENEPRVLAGIRYKF